MTARTYNVMNRLTSIGGAGHTMVEGNVNEFADVKMNNQSVLKGHFATFIHAFHL